MRLSHLLLIAAIGTLLYDIIDGPVHVWPSASLVWHLFLAVVLFVPALMIGVALAVLFIAGLVWLVVWVVSTFL